MTQKISKDWDVLTPLPVTVDAFNDLYTLVLKISGFEDKPSYKQYVASMIMHLPETQREAHVSYFVDALHKRLANEAAYAIIEEVRALEKLEAEQLKLKQEEVTTVLTAVTSECSATS